MAQNIYIAGAEAKNGKSVIALGLMELLSARTNHLGFFRPVIRSKDTPDPMIELMATRYALEIPYEAMYGCSNEEARDYIADDRYDDAQHLPGGNTAGVLGPVRRQPDAAGKGAIHDQPIRPSELDEAARGSGLKLDSLIGMTYNPLTKVYRLDKDVSVNYLAHYRTASD